MGLSLSAQVLHSIFCGQLKDFKKAFLSLFSLFIVVYFPCFFFVQKYLGQQFLMEFWLNGRVPICSRLSSRLVKAYLILVVVFSYCFSNYFLFFLKFSFSRFYDFCLILHSLAKLCFASV